MNVVFRLISEIFDPQAIFSVELLPSGGQAHHKMDCNLTPAFNRGSEHTKNGNSLLNRVYFPRSVSDFNEIFLVES